MGATYAGRIASLLHELGIPADYGVGRGMVLRVEATALVVADTNLEGGEIRLIPAAAAAWMQLKKSALTEGIILEIHSGFRSVERQAEVIRRKQAAGLPLDSILRYVAAPGYSEHHTGRAVDLGTRGQPPLEEEFEATDAFRWLGMNGKRFGFRLSYPRENSHGIGFEPWHWYFK